MRTVGFAAKGAEMASGAVEGVGVGRRARGLDRAFEILDYLRELRRPARPNEIAVGVEAPKSTTYELVNLMLKAGVLEYADKEGRVFLGRKLYFLGLAYQSQLDLTRECRSYLDELAETTRETSQLCMLDRDKYTVAMMREGARPFRNQLGCRRKNSNSLDRVGSPAGLASERRADPLLHSKGGLRSAERRQAGPEGFSCRGSQGPRGQVLLVRHAGR